MKEQKFKPGCPMFGCEKAGKCMYPNNCGDNGYITATTYKKKSPKPSRKENEPKS